MQIKIASESRKRWSKMVAFTTVGLLCVLWTANMAAQAVNVLTWRYDNTHQGQNTQESILTPTNVNTNTFGKLFSQTVDGNVFAQPLYVKNLTLPNGTTHNVVFIATENDSVYAFDADSNGGADSLPLWQASMLSTAHGAAAGATTVPSTDVQSGTGDINPVIGITSTPVIDLTAGAIFVVAASKENGTYVQRLHALNILTGNELSGSPVALSGSVPGNGNGSSGGKLAFSTLWQNNRVALGLFNGSIYIAFGSHGDDGPFHGWVLVYNETSLAQTAAYCTSPNGSGDGIWGAGAGMPIDTVSANGRLFLTTGNGDLTDYPPISASVDFGESVLRFDLSNGGFTPTDAFTTFNQAALTTSDEDVGSGGVLMLPDQPGTYPHLLIQAGKEGRIVVLNRDALNGYSPGGTSNPNAVQDITGQLQGPDSGLWSTPAYWNGNVYMWAEGNPLKMFTLTNGVLSSTYTAKSSFSLNYPGATPVVSSNGTSNGILWAIETDLYNTNGSSILYAFNATNIGSELYGSNQNPTRDDAGPAIKFQVPVVTNGKVYVGAGHQFDVYGLLSSESQAPAPVFSPPGGAYPGAQQITLTDSNSSAAIYYTTDGSTPTTTSTLYKGAFQVSSDSVVQAIASVSGYLLSPVASATYSFATQAPAPQFSPAGGSYTTPQSVTITDSTSGATIYYTTDGSTPTTASTVYTGPITVGSNTTISAIAAFTGEANSNVSTATYSIQQAGTVINFSNGFASVVGMTLNGSATNVDDTRLQLTTGVEDQSGSAFYDTPTNIQGFTTNFTFQLSDALADGMTFTMQNVGPTALGGNGGSLGYGPNPNTATTGGIASSVAIKFDFFSNAGEGTDSTGLYVDGASPTVPAIDMTSSGVILASGDTMIAQMTYDGTNLAMTITDIVTNAVFTHTFPVNIPATIGSNLAYIGFTGGSGGNSSSQKIENWMFTSQAPSPTYTPTLSPAGGTFTTAQKVTLSDVTPGAVIYYTTNGSTPTTSSAIYSSPITVSSGAVTIKTLAKAAGLSASAVASATYTIQSPVAATPTFSPAAGTYTSAQSVTISDSTPGAVIYYTTNGTTPTTSSAVYSAAIPVNASETLEALAVASGYAQSGVGTAAYVIQTSTGTGINFASGFTATGLQLNSVAKVNSSNYLELTDGSTNESSSAFWTTPVNIQSFTTNFTFQLTSASADGFTFVIQNAGLSALGGNGGSLGYGPNPNTSTTGGIGNSVAVKFDFYSNAGEGTDSTGFYLNGVTPTMPAVSMTSSGVVLLSGDTMAAQLTYDGTTLTLILNDTVTGKSFSYSSAVNIPSTVGASTAYVGFTGGNGGLTAIQNIKTWTFTSGTPKTAASPAFSPKSGTYSTNQSVSLSSTTSNATIYYTTNGSTPTHSSNVYSAPIAVGSSETIEALASATGYADSAVVSAAYVIQLPAAATPTFSPGAGTYTSAQSVTISDTTAGAVIYYTTDGSTPTTSSAVYSAAIPVSANTTLKALATATGYSQSAVGSAAYVFQTPAATPTFSPAAGTYTSAQSVTISDTTAGAVIYYTTDGSTPTTSSAVYSAAIPVSASSTLKALATATGYTQSAVGSAAYVIQTSSGTSINFANGFTSATGLQLNSVAKVNSSNYLELTDGGANESTSAFWTTPVNIQSFTTNFTFQLTSASADGFTFVIQNAGLSAVGGNGASLGYGPNPNTKTTGGIGNSVAVKFDFYSNAGEGTDSTGFYLNGVTPTVPAVDMTSSGVVLSSGDTMAAQLTYDGTTLTLILNDTVNGESFSYSSAVNIPSTVGASTAYLGFTGGSGGLSAIQNIKTWTFTSGTPKTAASPSFSPKAGTYSTNQNVSLSSTTSNATIYYTTDGSTPTHLSNVYSAPITVSSSETIKALASATGYADSTVASAAYVIQLPAAATPTFSPVAGTYTSAQSVTISDSTTGAVIYYTTDGSTPTTSSAVYSGTIKVSASSTLKALATASGYSQSAVGSAAYVIQAAAAATPTFSPAAGTYSSARSVTISDSTPGAVIYYTTNGSTPTTSSAVYSSAIAVSKSSTVEALAVASGYAQSAVGSAAYVIQAPSINFASGFTSASGLQLNSVAKVSSSNYLELTDGGASEGTSAFWTTPVNVQSFTTNFTFQLASASADGFTFVIQNAGLSALGGNGASLGYGPNPNTKTTGGIATSVAVKFDFYSNAGEGTDSTGFYLNGVTPTVPAVDMTSSGLSLLSGDTMAAQLTYDGTTLTLNLNDTVTGKSFSYSSAVNIPSTVGASTAYVGFTGGSGGLTSIQNIETWTFASGTP